MLALETLAGLRIVASPEALDGVKSSDETIALRLAPDDALFLDATEIQVTDDHAIAVPESGFVGVWLTSAQLVERVMPHIEWSMPEERPALAQGLVAGVPAKLWLDDDRALLLCAAPYAHELTERLG